MATAECEGMVEVEAAIIAASTSTIPEHKALKTAGTQSVKMSSSTSTTTIGRRTGVDVKAGKNIRRDDRGFENFADYWTDSENELNDSSFMAWRKNVPTSNTPADLINAKGPIRSMSPFTPSFVDGHTTTTMISGNKENLVDENTPSPFSSCASSSAASATAPSLPATAHELSLDELENLTQELSESLIETVMVDTEEVHIVLQQQGGEQDDDDDDDMDDDEDSDDDDDDDDDDDEVPDVNTTIVEPEPEVNTTIVEPAPEMTQSEEETTASQGELQQASQVLEELLSEPTIDILQSPEDMLQSQDDILDSLEEAAGIQIEMEEVVLGQDELEEETGAPELEVEEDVQDTLVEEELPNQLEEDASESLLDVSESQQERDASESQLDISENQQEEVSESQLDMSEIQPEEEPSESQLDVTESQPEEEPSESQLDMSEIQPEEEPSESQLDVSESQPEEEPSESQLDVSESQPEEEALGSPLDMSESHQEEEASESQLEVSESQPQEEASESQLDMSDTQPGEEASESQLDVSESQQEEEALESQVVESQNQLEQSQEEETESPLEESQSQAEESQNQEDADESQNQVEEAESEIQEEVQNSNREQEVAVLNNDKTKTVEQENNEKIDKLQNYLAQEEEAMAVYNITAAKDIGLTLATLQVPGVDQSTTLNPTGDNTGTISRGEGGPGQPPAEPSSALLSFRTRKRLTYSSGTTSEISSNMTAQSFGDSGFKLPSLPPVRTNDKKEEDKTHQEIKTQKGQAAKKARQNDVNEEEEEEGEIQSPKEKSEAKGNKKITKAESKSKKEVKKPVETKKSKKESKQQDKKKNAIESPRRRVDRTETEIIMRKSPRVRTLPAKYAEMEIDEPGKKSESDAKVSKKDVKKVKGGRKSVESVEEVTRVVEREVARGRKKAEAEVLLKKPTKGSRGKSVEPVEETTLNEGKNSKLKKSKEEVLEKRPMRASRRKSVEPTEESTREDDKGAGKSKKNSEEEVVEKRPMRASRRKSVEPTEESTRGDAEGAGKSKKNTEEEVVEKRPMRASRRKSVEPTEESTRDDAELTEKNKNNSEEEVIQGDIRKKSRLKSKDEVLEKRPTKGSRRKSVESIEEAKKDKEEEARNSRLSSKDEVLEKHQTRGSRRKSVEPVENDTGADEKEDGESWLQWEQEVLGKRPTRESRRIKEKVTEVKSSPKSKDAEESQEAPLQLKSVIAKSKEKETTRENEGDMRKNSRLKSKEDVPEKPPTKGSTRKSVEPIKDIGGNEGDKTSSKSKDIEETQEAPLQRKSVKALSKEKEITRENESDTRKNSRFKAKEDVLEKRPTKGSRRKSVESIVEDLKRRNEVDSSEKSIEVEETQESPLHRKLARARSKEKEKVVEKEASNKINEVIEDDTETMKKQRKEKQKSKEKVQQIEKEKPKEKEPPKAKEKPLDKKKQKERGKQIDEPLKEKEQPKEDSVLEPKRTSARRQKQMAESETLDEEDHTNDEEQAQQVEAQPPKKRGRKKKIQPEEDPEKKTTEKNKVDAEGGPPDIDGIEILKPKVIGRGSSMIQGFLLEDEKEESPELQELSLQLEESGDKDAASDISEEIPIQSTPEPRIVTSPGSLPSNCKVIGTISTSMRQIHEACVVIKRLSPQQPSSRKKSTTATISRSPHSPMTSPTSNPSPSASQVPQTFLNFMDDSNENNFLSLTVPQKLSSQTESDYDIEAGASPNKKRRSDTESEAPSRKKSRVVTKLKGRRPLSLVSSSDEEAEVVYSKSKKDSRKKSKLKKTNDVKSDFHEKKHFKGSKNTKNRTVSGSSSEDKKGKGQSLSTVEANAKTSKKSEKERSQSGNRDDKIDVQVSRVDVVEDKGKDNGGLQSSDKEPAKGRTTYNSRETSDYFVNRTKSRKESAASSQEEKSQGDRISEGEKKTERGRPRKKSKAMQAKKGVVTKNKMHRNGRQHSSPVVEATVSESEVDNGGVIKVGKDAISKDKSVRQSSRSRSRVLDNYDDDDDDDDDVNEFDGNDDVDNDADRSGIIKPHHSPKSLAKTVMSPVKSKKSTSKQNPDKPEVSASTPKQSPPHLPPPLSEEDVNSPTRKLSKKQPKNPRVANLSDVAELSSIQSTPLTVTKRRRKTDTAKTNNNEEIVDSFEDLADNLPQEESLESIVHEVSGAVSKRPVAVSASEQEEEEEDVSPHKRGRKASEKSPTPNSIIEQPSMSTSNKKTVHRDRKSILKKRATPAVSSAVSKKKRAKLRRNKRVSIAPLPRNSVSSTSKAGTPTTSRLSSTTVLTPGAPAQHFFEVTNSATPQQLPPLPPEEKIFFPKTPMEGTRHSKRTRVKPLNWFKNERIRYRRDETSGLLVVDGIEEAPPEKPEKAAQTNNKHKKRSWKNNHKTVQKRLSMHISPPCDPEEIEDHPNIIPVLNPNTQQEALVDCIRTNDQYQFLTPSQEEPDNLDPLLICKPIRQKAFTLGQLVIRPCEEKPLQLVRKDSMVFIVKEGKLLVTIHRTRSILETDDTFFVPSGNTYSIKNLRAEEAKLWFFQHKQGE